MSRAGEWTCDCGTVTVHRIRFEGPAAIAVGVATTLADADGVDLISSDPPASAHGGAVELDVSVEGPLDAVRAAVKHIRDGLPDGASIEVTGD
jgi:hypothetical protein